MGKAAKLKAARKGLSVEGNENFQLSSKGLKDNFNINNSILTKEKSKETIDWLSYLFEKMDKVKGMDYILDAYKNSNHLFSKQEQDYFHKVVYEDLNLFATMCRELEGIERQKSKPTLYAVARKVLYKALIELYIENKFIEEIRKKELYEEIIRAGQILWDCEGIKGMKDYLLWSFIPISQHYIIENLWDKIGDWKSLNRESIVSKWLAFMGEQIQLPTKDIIEFIPMCAEICRIERESLIIYLLTDGDYILYQTLINLYIENRQDYIDETKREEVRQEIIRAGKMSYHFKTPEETCDLSIWSIIPESQRDTVRSIWDSIEDFSN